MTKFTGVMAAIILFIGLFLGTSISYQPARTVGPQQVQPAVIMEVLDPSLDQFAPMWRTEIGRRFPNAVGVLVHGGDFVENQWIAGVSFTPRHVTPMAEVVRFYQAKHPGRTIVLLACNTGHLKLGIPGVFYAHSSVWCVPDRGITPEMYSNGLATERMSDGSRGFEFSDPTLAQQARWEAEPDIVGNIYEFEAD